MKIAPSTGPMQGVHPIATSPSERQSPGRPRCRQPLRANAHLEPIEDGAEDAGRQQAEQDHQHARHLARLRDPKKRPAEDADRGPEDDEEDAEAGHEEERLRQHGRAGGGDGCLESSATAAFPRNAR